jgi:hypothetical protein
MRAGGLAIVVALVFAASPTLAQSEGEFELPVDGQSPIDAGPAVEEGESDEPALIAPKKKPAPRPKKKAPARTSSASTSSSSSSSSSSSTASSNTSGQGSAPVGRTDVVTGIFPVGASAAPQGKRFGLGVQLGWPTAFTGKYFLTPDQGLAFGLGVLSPHRYGEGAASLHVDYLWHPNLLARSPAFDLSWYVGGGLGINVFQFREFPDYGIAWTGRREQFFLAARVPVGFSSAITALPIEVYGELVPSVLVYPAFSVGLGAAFGFRYFFL